MKISIITNSRAPYRIKQLNKISEERNYEITVYYTNKDVQGRKWLTEEAAGFKEVNLNGFKISENYGYINYGVIKLVRNSDLVIIGGYEQPTYIMISIICRILKKPYSILFDGISTNRIIEKEKIFKKGIKTLVIKGSKAIWGNGLVSKEYFTKNFKYNSEKIINQGLTVDINGIDNICKNKNDLKNQIRDKYAIKEKYILMYSGRVIEIKNLKLIVDAISICKFKKSILFFIAGGGTGEEELIKYVKSKGIKIIITGFIEKQEELFKLYALPDIFILPSILEPWGLVVNEAMAASLPVLVSSFCGCSMDLVQDGENGYTFSPYDEKDLSDKIQLILDSDLKKMGSRSREIISQWNFENSKRNFLKLVKISNNQ